LRVGERVPEINPDYVNAYCDVVFRDPPAGAAIALRGLPEARRDTPPHLVWVDARSSVRNRTIVKFTQDCNERGLAAYCIPGFVRPGGAGAADVVGLSVLLIDVDAGDIADKCMRATSLLGTPSLAVWSGGIVEGQKKAHLYWRTDDSDPERVCRLRSLAARILGTDDSFGIGRAHQPVRIAGSIHRKAAPTLVEIAYGSESSVKVLDQIVHLETQTSGQATLNGGPGPGDLPRNGLGLSRQVSLDELVGMHIGHGRSDVNRFEALTRMAGMMLAQIGDTANAEECAREFGYFRQWAITHIENVERDYRLFDHWRRLLQRERWKRQQPRRTFRRQARTRNF
jgi:hypothetical protein